MRLLKLAALLVCLAASHNAAATIISATDTGWYDSAGGHNANNENYAVGWGELRPSTFSEIRNFFVFDLSGIGPVTGAVLRAYQTADTQSNPAGYFSLDASETWSLFDVTTNVADIITGSAGAAAFNDFADGMNYGSKSVSASDNGNFVEIALNADALASLSSASGLWAIGGALTTLSRLPQNEAIFGWSEFDPRVELVLTTSSPVPEPTSLLLIALGLAVLAWSSRRYGSLKVRSGNSNI